MIAVDTSALVAVALGEDEREEFLDTIRRAGRVLVATPTVLEFRMVLRGRRGEESVLLADAILAQPVFEAVPPSAEDVRVAYEAFVVYGKGAGHPAGLSFGDLFSYALAKTRDLPLLFKGDDFVHTDLVRAS